MAASDGNTSGGLPVRRITINQLIGFNMMWFRKAAGMTQEALGQRLGGWSGASVSAAERSWEGTRIRKFDADEVVKIADALGVPLIALFLPPPDAGTAVDYYSDFGGPSPAALQDLLPLMTSEYRGHETPAMTAYRERLFALGDSMATDHPVALAVLSRARQAVDDIFTSGRREAQQVTSDARARAESLELDAQERHRKAMGSLIQSREELERRVDDLRKFEREYRLRLIAYLEGQLADLRAGVADSGIFPAIPPAPPGGENAQP